MKSLLLTIYALSWTVLGLLMCVMYPVVIWHIVQGNRNKWLIMLCLILMANNIGGIFSGYSLYEL